MREEITHQIEAWGIEARVRIGGPDGWIVIDSAGHREVRELILLLSDYQIYAPGDYSVWVRIDGSEEA